LFVYLVEGYKAFPKSRNCVRESSAQGLPTARYIIESINQRSAAAACRLPAPHQHKLCPASSSLKESPQQPSTSRIMEVPRLGRLPPELRLIIWKLVLKRDNAITVTADNKSCPMRTTSFHDNETPLALLGVCQQMRAECTEVFYATNTLHFTFAVDRNGGFTRLKVIATIRAREQEMNEVTLFRRFCNSVGQHAVVELRDVELIAHRHLFSSTETMRHHLRNLCALKIMDSSTKVTYTLIRMAANANEETLKFVIRKEREEEDVINAMLKIEHLPYITPGTMVFCLDDLRMCLFELSMDHGSRKLHGHAYVWPTEEEELRTLETRREEKRKQKLERDVDELHCAQRRAQTKAEARAQKWNKTLGWIEEQTMFRESTRASESG
jgi:hypothetical protein